MTNFPNSCTFRQFSEIPVRLVFSGCTLAVLVYCNSNSKEMYKEIETIALEGLASVVALRKGSLFLHRWSKQSLSFEGDLEEIPEWPT